MKLIIVSDIHLRTQDSMGISISGTNSRLTDRLNTLKKTVDYAIANKATYYIIDGDVFDKVNPSEKLRSLFKDTVLLPLISNGIHIVFNMGNHDTNGEIVNLQTEASLIESILQGGITFIVEPTIMEFEGVKAYFIPYGFEIPVNNQGCVLAFGHHGISGAETGVGVVQRDGEEISLEQLSIFKLSFFGHYHKPQTLICRNGSEVVYVGSTNVWDFGERLDKKRFIELNIVGKSFEWKSLPLPERRFIQLEVHEGESWETSEDIKDAVIKLVLAGRSEWLKSLDIQGIKKSYEANGVHKIDIEPKPNKKDRNLVIELDGTESEEDIIKSFCNKLDLDKDDIDFGLNVFRGIL